MATNESADEVEALLSMAAEVVPASSSLQLAGLHNLEANFITEVSMSELKPIVMTMANMANIVEDNSVVPVTSVPEPVNHIQISDRSETVLASHLLSTIPPVTSRRPVRPTTSEVYRDSTTGVTYEIQRGGTRRGGDKLIDSLGFTYNLKAGKSNPNISYWWCAVRNHQLRCPASVTQKGNLFMRGKKKHEHLVGQSTPKPLHNNAQLKAPSLKRGRPVGSWKARPSGMTSTNRDFKIIKNGSKAGMDLLKDCLGYTYTLKKVIGGGLKTYWCCSVRNKHLRCPASVIQYGNKHFSEGSFDHKHMPYCNIPAAPHESIPSLQRMRLGQQYDELDLDDDEEETDHSYGQNKPPPSNGNKYLNAEKIAASNNRVRVSGTSREKKRREHQTFLGPRCTINLTKCDDAGCNCRLVHCPFCDKHHFKPTKAGRVQDHLELTHFAHGVQYDDLMIVKCFHDCDLEKSFGHYHCVFCFRQMLKRTAYARHMLRHMMKMGIPDRLLVLPDSKYPDVINAYGYEIPICKTAACESGNQEKHYHCPNCSTVCRERSLTVNHLWRCLQKKRDGGSTQEELEEDTTASIEEDLLMLHFSHVKSFKDIPIDKCMSIDCCHQKYHCKLCPENVFMPTYRQHLIAHYITHWKQRVIYKNFSILKCFHPCDGVDRSMCKTRYHYHCPICCKILLTKGTFEEHLRTCHMYRFGENLIQSKCKGDLDESLQEDIMLSQESAPLNENVDFMEDQLTSQAIMNAERQRRSRGREKTFKKKGWRVGAKSKRGRKALVKQESESEDDIVDDDEEEDESEDEDEPPKRGRIVEKDVYELCSAVISPKVARKVKSTNHLKSILEKTKKVKLSLSERGQYLLSGPATELLEAQKMLTRTLNKQIKGDTPSLQVKSPPPPKKKSPVSPKKVETRKGKGRQKKASRDGDSFPYSEIRQIIEASKESSDDTPKRGRGRPSKKTPIKPAPKIKSAIVKPTSTRRQKVETATKTEVPRTPGRYGTRGVRMNYLEMNSGGFRKEIKQEPVSDPEDTPVVVQSPKMAAPKTRKRGRPRKVELEPAEDEANEEEVGEAEEMDVDIADREEEVGGEENGSEEEEEETKKDNEEEEEEDMDDSLSLFDDSDDDFVGEEDEEDVMEAEHDVRTKVTVTDSAVKRLRTTNVTSQVPSVFKLGMRKSNLPKDDKAEAGESNLEAEKTDSKCSLCEDYTAETFSGLTEHLKVFHHVYDPPRCDVCEIDFDTGQSLNHHIERKHGPPPERVKYICEHEECGKEFVSEPGLTGHTNRVHLGVSETPKEKRYLCDSCEYKCNSIGDIFEHKKVEHDEPIKCEVCDKRFVNYASLKSHNQLVHSTTSVLCTICHKSFSNETYLNKHMKSHFAASFSCHICNKSIRSKTSLREHLETHKDPSERTYKYMCSYCGKQFALKTNLDDHINKHTGSRPYKCDICQKAFGFRSMLMKHKTFVHSSERPFKCGFCSKGFKFMNLLQNHMTTHTNTSKHVCQHCSKSFSTASTLKFHTQKCRGLAWKRNQVLPAAQPGTLLVFTDSGTSNTVNPIQTESTPEQEAGIQYVVAQEGEQQVIYTTIDGTETSTVQEVETLVKDSATTTQVQDQVEDQVQYLEQPEQSQQQQEPEQSQQQPDQQPEGDSGLAVMEVYACSECKATFNTYKEAETHVLTAHSAAAAQTEENLELGADNVNLE